MRLRLAKRKNSHGLGNVVNFRNSITWGAALLVSTALVSSCGCGGRGAASILGLAVPQNSSQSATSNVVLGQVPISHPLPLQPPPPHGQRLFPDTTVGIHALQVFDEDHENIISPSQGTADGSRYAS